MSVINQVLIDLERRRASGPERGLLPRHVRALPDGGHRPQWGWIAAGGLATAGAVIASWMLLSGVDLSGLRGVTTSAPARGADIAIEKVVSASAGVNADAPRREAAGQAAAPDPAFRLSLELSSPPPAETVAVAAPVPTERVIGKADATPPASREPAALPRERREAAKPPATVASAPQSGATPPARPEITKAVREPTPREVAESEYRKAASALHQRRPTDAQEGFQAALAQYPGHHAARQALVGLLLDGKQYAEAEQVLQEGIRLSPSQIGFVMTLARLQVNRDDNAGAIGTLRASQEYAKGSADYLAFLAALLQRQGTHAGAIEQFQSALRLRPDAGVWWLGLGMSLQAIGRIADAQEAYRRARATNSLNPELASFAEQRLRQLQ